MDVPQIAPDSQSDEEKIEVDKPEETETQDDSSTDQNSKKTKKEPVKEDNETAPALSNSKSKKKQNRSSSSGDQETSSPPRKQNKTANKGSSTSQIKVVPVRPPFFNSRGKKVINKEQAHASKQKWGQIHHDHFDWYMFPIEDGSHNVYNVLEADCLELKSDPEWLAGYHEGVELVAKAWGWDVKLAQQCDPAEPGMGWTSWDVRLAKIIRSLWIFQQKEYMESMQKFARHVAPRGGLSYGWINLDEVFFMTLP